MSYINGTALIITAIFALYGAMKLFTDRSNGEKEAAILWVLQHEEERGMYALDIASITGVGISMLYPTLSRLEDRQLLRRTVDELNCRHRFHFVSDEARRLLDEARHREDA